METCRSTLSLLAAGERFDLAILDMQMPELDGEMLATEIKRAVGPAAPRLLLLSSIGRGSASLPPGMFAAVLNEPAKPSQIYDALVRALTDEPVVVALTANAMQGERELCLAAGMNDYRSKPIKSAELVTALARAPRGRDTASPWPQ